MAPRETENNAYTKFWGDKQRVLWYVMTFNACSGQFWQHGLVLKLELLPRILSSQISFSTTWRAPHDNGRIYTSDKFASR